MFGYVGFDFVRSGVDISTSTIPTACILSHSFLNDNLTFERAHIFAQLLASALPTLMAATRASMTPFVLTVGS